MSSCPQETIIVDGKETFLRGDSPLEQLWSKENRPKFRPLQISEYEIEYIASWMIEDSFLWLTDFQSGNYTIKKLSLDGVRKKIKASWYNGDVVYGIGIPESSFLGLYYRDYATYEVIKGEIILESYKEIQYEPVKYEDTFVFGKHKGRKIEDVIVGINKYEQKSIIDKYLTDAIHAFQSGGRNSIKRVYLPGLVNENVKKLFEYPNRLNVSVNIDKYVFLKGSDEDADRIERFGNYFMECFEQSFYSADGHISHYQEYGTGDDVSLSSLSIKSDAQYISWVINNVERFQLQPHLICGKHICRQLSGFDIHRVAYDIILFKPVIKESEHSFPVDIVNISIERCLKRYNLRYDVEKKWYVKVKPQAKEEEDDTYDNRHPSNDIDHDELYFDAMTDGQLGDYEDFKGDIDDLETWQRG